MQGPSLGIRKKIEYTPLGGGVDCRHNICDHAAEFVISFNLICNMTLFCPFDPKGQGEGSADKIFSSMLMHS